MAEGPKKVLYVRHDIARKLVYNWVSEDGAVEAFIL